MVERVTSTLSQSGSGGSTPKMIATTKDKVSDTKGHCGIRCCPQDTL